MLIDEYTEVLYSNDAIDARERAGEAGYRLEVLSVEGGQMVEEVAALGEGDMLMIPATALPAIEPYLKNVGHAVQIIVLGNLPRDISALQSSAALELKPLRFLPDLSQEGFLQYLENAPSIESESINSLSPTEVVQDSQSLQGEPRTVIFYNPGQLFPLFAVGDDGQLLDSTGSVLFEARETIRWVDSTAVTPDRSLGEELLHFYSIGVRDFVFFINPQEMLSLISKFSQLERARFASSMVFPGGPFAAAFPYTIDQVFAGELIEENSELLCLTNFVNLSAN